MAKSIDEVERLITLIPYLKANPGVTVQEVAAEFNVDPARIRRDVSRLFMCGLPGGYHDDLIDLDQEAWADDEIVISNADFIGRPMQLFRDEAISLVVALGALRDTMGAQSPAIVDSALAKLSEALRADAEVPVNVHVEPVDPAIRETIERGIATGVRIDLTYVKEHLDSEDERQIDPLRLFVEDGRIYVDAWCHRAQDLRKFRLDRISRASLTALPIETHEAPDPVGARYQPADDDHWAVFEAAPGAGWVLESPEVERLDDVDGRPRVGLRASDVEWLKRYALRHAGHLRIVEPEWLAELVASDAALALRAYDG